MMMVLEKSKIEAKNRSNLISLFKNEYASYFLLSLLRAFPPNHNDISNIYNSEIFNLVNHKSYLPFGPVPRLLIILLIIEIKKTALPVIPINRIYTEYLRRFALHKLNDMNSVQCIRDQILRLFSTSITVKVSKNSDSYVSQASHHEEFNLWLNPINYENQSVTFPIVLTEKFFNILINNIFDFDFQILNEICTSSLKIDIYVWLICCRTFLFNSILIPIDDVIKLFEINQSTIFYKNTEFKKYFIKELELVSKLYSKINILIGLNEIKITPSKTKFKV